MSKSLGTGIDPLELIDEHGADATRYGLLKMSSSQDVRFSIGAIEEGRKLSNKLWNASRLVLGAGPASVSRRRPRDRGALDLRQARRRRAGRSTQTSARSTSLSASTGSTTSRSTTSATGTSRRSSLGLREHDGCRATALAALERLLKLLHPVMPHVTEEIWSQLSDRKTRLIVAPWPEPDEQLRRRSACARPGPGGRGHLPAERRARRARRATTCGSSRPSSDPSASETDGNADAEVERLRKEIARAEGMLANERFTSKAPAEVVEAEREKLERYRRELDAISN